MRTGICIVLATALVAFELPLSGAQAPIRGVVTNVRSTASGGTVEILYDLAAPQAGLAFDVTIEASEDGGSSYPVKLSSVSGDVGAGIIPGVAKRVVWNAARDVERAAFDQFQYRVNAIAIRPAALPSPAATLGTPSPAAPPRGGGGSAKWLLIGGGAAAAAGAVALSGGGNNPPVVTQAQTAPIVPPTVADVGISGLTDVLIATANSVTFTVTASSSEGESLHASWAFGDGTSDSAAIVAGSASVRKTYANAGTFVPRVTITAPRGGSVFRDYQSITVGTVTGRWIGRFTNSSGTFTMNLTQNANTVGGDAVTSLPQTTQYLLNPLRITQGSVSGPPTTMRFRISDSGGRSYNVNVTGSSDQRTFTGTITGTGTSPFLMSKQ